MAKTLILYFSVYDSTHHLAEEIARQTGGDLLEIEPLIPYDKNRDHYDALAAYAKKEHDEDQRPAIKNTIDLSGYDTVFIGYPMWWYTFPMIIYTLFDTVDFSGKTVVPFNTHMGSRDGGTYKTVREKARGATAGKRRSGVPRLTYGRSAIADCFAPLHTLAHLTHKYLEENS
jgi:flavodoxin